MIIHDLKQGSKEWHDLRANHFNASEAAAMMGDSPYMSREELLHQKKTGITPEVTPQKQAIFDKGHAAEEKARPIACEVHADVFRAKVGTSEDYPKLLASFDGITDSLDFIWEHKLFNKTLAENVVAEILNPTHYWQLEHQLLVSDANEVLFMTSDGTEENCEYFYYASVPQRRADLIAGWDQFEKDLEAYVVKAKQEVIVAEPVVFPVLTAAVSGSVVESNINELLTFVKQKAEIEIDKPLATDLDFANAEQLVKSVKKVRATLKESVAKIQGGFVSFSEFSDVAAQIDTALQKLQSAKEKAVKSEKESRKSEIIENATIDLAGHLYEINRRLGVTITPPAHDFAAAVKGKRNIQSMEDAVKQVLADAKIEAVKTAKAVEDNLAVLESEASELRFLFNDLQQIITKDHTDFINLVKLRIAEHKQAEEDRKEVERQRKEQLEKERKRKELDERIKAQQAKSGEISKKNEAPPSPEAHQPIAANQAGACPAGEVFTPDIGSPVGQLTLAEEISLWADRHNLSFIASQELEDILKMYGVNLSNLRNVA